MSEHEQARPPNAIILSLQSPPRLWQSKSDWDLEKQFWLGGVAVEGNDTPFVALADVLIDVERRWFVGLTWRIADPLYWDPMRKLAGRLDPRVVHYNDRSTPRDRLLYQDDSTMAHWLEIRWTPTEHLGVECAQLCCGQWFWWYAVEDSSSRQNWTPAPTIPGGPIMPGSWGISPPVIAFGLLDIPDILLGLDLTFPDVLDFPSLEVAVA